ncbi:MAG: c-type cytochrome [Longimicrobiales bacterium]
MRRRDRGRAAGILIAGAITVASGGCTMLDNALAAVPIFAFLREAPSFDPYEAPRLSPPGAVPFASPTGPWEPEVQPTQASLLAFAASPFGRNPVPPGDPEALELGKTMFERHCRVCHAANGTGNGPVVGPGKFPLGPSLLAPTAVGATDGYIYAVIKAGRGLMPPYGPRTTVQERWSIVTYLRQLQGGAAGAAAQPGAAARDTAR